MDLKNSNPYTKPMPVRGPSDSVSAQVSQAGKKSKMTFVSGILGPDQKIKGGEGKIKHRASSPPLAE